MYNNICPYSFDLWWPFTMHAWSWGKKMSANGWNWRKNWEFKLMLKCEHQCHCACSLEIGTCIINDAGRQAAHKKNQRKYMVFLVEYCQKIFDTNVFKVYINFQHKKNTKLTGTIPLMIQFHFDICQQQKVVKRKTTSAPVLVKSRHNVILH